MLILAIDLGKFKSVACSYRSDDDAAYQAIQTAPEAIHELLIAIEPDRLVVDVGTVTGWVHDIAKAVGIEVQVASPATEGWRWRRDKRKSRFVPGTSMAMVAAGCLTTTQPVLADHRRSRSPRTQALMRGLVIKK